MDILPNDFPYIAEYCVYSKTGVTSIHISSISFDFEQLTITFYLAKLSLLKYALLRRACQLLCCYDAILLRMCCLSDASSCTKLALIRHEAELKTLCAHQMICFEPYMASVMLHHVPSHIDQFKFSLKGYFTITNEAPLKESPVFVKNIK